MNSLNLKFILLQMGNGASGFTIVPDLEDDKKKYNAMEPVLQEIQKSTALAPTDKKAQNVVLNMVVDKIIDEMKKNDPLFKVFFNKKLYGGSYYDGLKLHAPDEYDLDLALKFNTKFNAQLEKSDKKGFVRVKVNLESIKKDPENVKDWRALERMVDSCNNLLTEEFRAWFEGVLNKAKNNLNGNVNGHKFSLSKSGPAMTLKLYIDANKLVSVDLVPAIIFSKKTDWPPSPFRINPIISNGPTALNKDEFLVVPKDPPNKGYKNISWRLSFQEQEKLIINGKNGLKDTIRLLKLLRSRQFQDSTLASYFIKTVMMWFKEFVDDNFWCNSRSYIFMMGLKYFRKLISKGQIPYYWNPEYNLLMAVNPATISNWSNRLDRIIRNLEAKIGGSIPDMRNTMFNILGLDQKGAIEKDDEGLSLSFVVIAREEAAMKCDINGEIIDSIRADVLSTNFETACSPNHIKGSTNKPDHSMWKNVSEFEAIGINVAKKLEKMDYKQVEKAEKLISQILWMGLNNQLTDGTSIKIRKEETASSWRCANDTF